MKRIHHTRRRRSTRDGIGIDRILENIATADIIDPTREKEMNQGNGDTGVAGLIREIGPKVEIVTA